MRTRNLLLAAAAAFVLLALPAAAPAADLCVGSVPGCVGYQFDGDPAGITAAINAADLVHAGPDTVHIAAGPYAITDTTFPMVDLGEELDIVGAGPGQTIFSGAAAGNGLIHLMLPTATSELSGFTMSANAASNFLSAVQLTRGSIRDFEINLTGFQATGVVGIVMNNGTQATDGSISIEGTKTALTAYSGTVTASHLAINGNGGGAGVSLGGTVNATLSHLKISGLETSFIQQNGTATLADSLVDMRAQNNAVGVWVRDQNTGLASTINFAGARITTVGTGDGQVGLLTGTGASADITDFLTWSLKDAVFYETGTSATSLLCSGINSTGSAGVVATNIGFQIPSPGCPYTPSTLVTLSASPFVDFGAFNYRPAWDSQLIDLGASAPNPVGTTDESGLTRVVNGDNNGTATVDVGAYEYQAAPPAGAITAPTSAKPGDVLAFSHSMVDPDPTNSISGVVWSFGDGSTSTAAAPTHAYAAGGAFTVTLSATNEAGSVGTASAVVTVSSLPVAPPVDPPVAPPLATAKLTAKAKKAFTRTGKGFAAPKKKQPFFAVTFSGAVKAKFTLASISRSKKLKTVKGSQTIKVKNGSNKFAFGGKFGGKKLKAGKYRVTITPLSQSGVAGKPVTANIALK